MRRLASPLIALATALMTACAGGGGMPMGDGDGDGDTGDGDGDGDGDGGQLVGCQYPGTDTSPWVVGGPLASFRWASAKAFDDSDAPLDLEEVHCDGDPNRDWSPFDLLLFVSVPAW